MSSPMIWLTGGQDVMQFGVWFGQFSAVTLCGRVYLPYENWYTFNEKQKMGRIYAVKTYTGYQHQKHLLQCAIHCPEDFRFRYSRDRKQDLKHCKIGKYNLSASVWGSDIVFVFLNFGWNVWKYLNDIYNSHKSQGYHLMSVCLKHMTSVVQWL